MENVLTVGGVPPGSPNPDPISDQNNVIFHTRFQPWARLFEGRLAPNPELNLTRVSFSCV